MRHLGIGEYVLMNRRIIIVVVHGTNGITMLGRGTQGQGV